MEAGADGEPLEACCVLVCSPWFAQPDFIENQGPPAQWMAPSTVVWALTHQSLIKKMLYRFAHNLILQRHFLIDVLSSKMTLACVKLTKNYLSQNSNKDKNMFLLQHKLGIILFGFPCCRNWVGNPLTKLKLV